MKVKPPKQTGWLLMLCGLMGAGITAAEMIAIN